MKQKSLQSATCLIGSNVTMVKTGIPETSEGNEKDCMLTMSVTPSSTEPLEKIDVTVSLEPLPTPEQMREWDKRSVQLGIPEVVLMENAARAALRVLQDAVGPLEGKRIALFMGPGNNGGDAACLARHLLDRGAFPVVFYTKALKKNRGVVSHNVRLSRACGVKFLPIRAWHGENYDIIIDGLLGTGFHGELKKNMLSLIQSLNKAGKKAFVLAIDVPSGLDAIRGQACPESIRADVTATFSAAKPGLVLPWATPFTGKLVICDIGTPKRIRDGLPCEYRLLYSPRFGLRLPSTPQASFKNSYGHVLVIGGAPGFCGAAHLAGLASLRCGAGLVSVAAPEASIDSIGSGRPELMTRPLRAKQTKKMGSFSAIWPTDISQVLDLLARVQAVVVGPGMGNTEDAASFLTALLQTAKLPPLVMDADALNLLAQHPDLFRFLRKDDVLTPHPGEAARLLGKQPHQIQSDRFAAVEALAALSPATVILKGAGTLVMQQDSVKLVAPFDVPQLSCCGSGDVLSGVIASLLARGMPAFTAAGFGVLVHAIAGNLLAKDFPSRGCLAGEIAATLPKALASLTPPKNSNVAPILPLKGRLEWQI